MKVLLILSLLWTTSLKAVESVTKAEDLSEEEIAEIRKDKELGNPEDTNDEYTQKIDEKTSAIKDEVDNSGDNDPEIDGYPFQVVCTNGYSNGYKTFNEAEEAATTNVAEGVGCSIN